LLQAPRIGVVGGMRCDAEEEERSCFGPNFPSEPLTTAVRATLTAETRNVTFFFLLCVWIQVTSLQVPVVNMYVRS
jgi:hypothetical protein